jgi:integrase
MAKRFTDISIRNLKPGLQRREIPDPGARGLYAIVEPSGYQSFAVRYRFGGKPRKLSLGHVSLSIARKQCADALNEVAQGRDPSLAKREAKQARRDSEATTFRSVAIRYFKIKAGMKAEGDGVTFTGKMRTARRRLADTERLVFPTLGNRPIAEIKRSQIVDLLDTIETENGSVMADRMLGTIRSILNWHMSRSDDYRSPIVRGMARTSNHGRARTRILEDSEIRAIWAVQAEDSFLPLVKFLLLTGARRSEAANMTWDELRGNVWTLPAARNKTGVDLERPLSEAAMAIVNAQPRTNGFVFPAARGKAIVSFAGPKAVLDVASRTSDWTIHDLRRTARSLLSRAGVDSDHAERCLGHVIRGVRGVYDRHEYRAEKEFAYASLAALIERIVNPPEGDNVTEIAKFDKRRA